MDAPPVASAADGVPGAAGRVRAHVAHFALHEVTSDGRPASSSCRRPRVTRPRSLPGPDAPVATVRARKTPGSGASAAEAGVCLEARATAAPSGAGSPTGARTGRATADVGTRAGIAILAPARRARTSGPKIGKACDDTFQLRVSGSLTTHQQGEKLRIFEFEQSLERFLFTRRRPRIVLCQVAFEYYVEFTRTATAAPAQSSERIG